MLLAWRSLNGECWLLESSPINCEPAVVVSCDKSVSIPSVCLGRRRWCDTHKRFPGLLNRGEAWRSLVSIPYATRNLTPILYIHRYLMAPFLAPRKLLSRF
ncbi:hypothetical protein BOTBODRAFT_432895 [Botryobasidium botryosum FD-172 SS1]|uniref:Uncharacterized protein n=1 Tax=Botryobasidium botryosum (strain FD-172 SS1) TaxID=930990 RepID=A0A067MUB8_BOTB1|nr:hypothetical protein BOTBODRAFT_432895 [Botryobasidium botryosum FD-172 SS1]